MPDNTFTRQLTSVALKWPDPHGVRLWVFVILWYKVLYNAHGFGYMGIYGFEIKLISLLQCF